MTALRFTEISAALRAHRFPRVDWVVGLASGGTVPAALVAHQLGLPLALLWINYRDESNCPVRAEPALLRPLPELPPEARVLLVDDVCVSGRTLQTAAALLAPRPVERFVLKGRVPYALFQGIEGCVQWPWKPPAG